MSDIAGQRREVAAELVKKVAPRSERDATPKATVVKTAVEHFEEHRDDLLASDPFLRDYSHTFVNPKTFLDYWADIRRNLAKDGVSMLWNSQGVWISKSKKAIEAAHARERQNIQRTAERYNVRSELTNKRKRMQMPSLAIQLLLPAGEADD